MKTLGTGPTAQVGERRAIVSAPAAVRPLDPARADALREAISAGRYPLDSARLAERLMALGLLAAGKPR